MVVAVAFLVFIACAIAVVWRPPVILAVAFCSYSFEQWAQATSTFFAYHPTVINYAVGGLTILALLAVVLRGENPVTPVTYGFLVWLSLIILAIASYIWSIDKAITLQFLIFYMPYVVTFVALVPQSINRQGDVRIGLMSVLIVGAGIMVMLLLNTRVHEWGRTILVAEGRGVVDRGGNVHQRLSPLAIAEMSGQLLLIATLLNFKRLGRFLVVGRWLVILLAIALIIRSGTRGQMFASVLAAATFFGVSRGYGRVLLTVVGPAVLAMFGGLSFWLFSAFTTTTASRWSLEKMFAEFQETRLFMVQKLLNYWMESSPIHWVLGLGSSSSFSSEILGVYPHMIMVEVLAELGVVGFVLLCILYLLVVRAWFKLYRIYRHDPIGRGVVATLGALALYGFILSFKQGSFLGQTNTYLVCLLICRYEVLASGAHRRALARYARRYPWQWQQTSIQQPAT